MIKKISTTFLSFLLAILLVFFSLPFRAYAESGDDIEEPAPAGRLEIVAINTNEGSDVGEQIELLNNSLNDILFSDIAIKFCKIHSDKESCSPVVYDQLPDDQIYIDAGSGLVLTRKDRQSQFGFSYSPAKGEALILYVEDSLQQTLCWGGAAATSQIIACAGQKIYTGLSSDNSAIAKYFCLNNDDKYVQFEEFRVGPYEQSSSREQCVLKDDNLAPPLDGDDNQDPISIINPCSLIKINEISFADSHKFIEFINESNETILTANCAVKRGATKSNLDRAVCLNTIFKPGEIKSFNIAGTTMTQSNASVAIAIYDKNNDQMVKTKDENGDETTYQVQYIKAKENASYAWFDDEEHTGWFQTFAPTPGAENIYQQFQNCPAGKMINPDTGNCVNIPLPPADCPAGQYRNPETGRCKKLPEETVYVPCQEGYYRNPETGRCRKIETETVLKECPEGWERNPETNRCRKKVDNSPAGFAVQNTGPTPESNMLASFASGGVAVTGTLITASYRQDFMNFIRKLRGKK